MDRILQGHEILCSPAKIRRIHIGFIWTVLINYGT